MYIVGDGRIQLSLRKQFLKYKSQKLLFSLHLGQIICKMRKLYQLLQPSENLSVIYSGGKESYLRQF
jgi:hypothetical protein